MMKLIDANEAATLKGYVLYVLYAPGCYRPCPSVFTLRDGETYVAAHFTALYEAVEYVDEMKHRNLIGNDSRLFIRNDEGVVVWRNAEMLASNARYLAARQADDSENPATWLIEGSAS